MLGPEKTEVLASVCLQAYSFKGIALYETCKRRRPIPSLARRVGGKARSKIKPTFRPEKRARRWTETLFCDRQVLAFWLAVMQASKHATESLMRVASCIKIWFVSLLVVRSLSSHFFACGVTKLFPACPTGRKAVIAIGSWSVLFLVVRLVPKCEPESMQELAWRRSHEKSGCPVEFAADCLRLALPSAFALSKIVLSHLPKVVLTATF